jgi:hypothetical protein
LVHPDDLRWASAAIVERWRDQAQGDDSWLAWVREPDNLRFVALTLCRLLYTLDTGSAASKPASARWAERTLPSRWSALIGRELTEPHANAADVSEDAVAGALSFLEYVDERYREWRASSAH